MAGTYSKHDYMFVILFRNSKFNCWLQCFREATLPSDIFLTTLRITDNCDELKSTKEIVSKEIQQLVNIMFN